MAMIVQAGDPVLRRVAVPVPAEKLATQELRALVDEMIATMRAAPGVGLAAPQIGVSWQLIVVEDDGERASSLSDGEREERGRSPLPLTAIVNPEIELSGGDQRATFFEGCLSISGWSALVPRALRASVKGLSPEGDPLKLELEGWPARILQHEIDHLRGVLYIDRMLSRSFSETDLAHELWSGKSTAEVIASLGIEAAQNRAKV
jgi:peptide deformylase